MQATPDPNDRSPVAPPRGRRPYANDPPTSDSKAVGLSRPLLVSLDVIDILRLGARKLDSGARGTGPLQSSIGRNRNKMTLQLRRFGPATVIPLDDVVELEARRPEGVQITIVCETSVGYNKRMATTNERLWLDSKAGYRALPIALVHRLRRRGQEAV